MTIDVIELAVGIAIFCLLFYGAYRLMLWGNVPEPVRLCIVIFLAIIFLLWFVGAVGLGEQYISFTFGNRSVN